MAEQTPDPQTLVTESAETRGRPVAVQTPDPQTLVVTQSAETRGRPVAVQTPDPCHRRANPGQCQILRSPHAVEIQAVAQFSIHPPSLHPPPDFPLACFFFSLSEICYDLFYLLIFISLLPCATSMLCMELYWRIISGQSISSPSSSPLPSMRVVSGTVPMAKCCGTSHGKQQGGQ